MRRQCRNNRNNRKINEATWRKWQYQWRKPAMAAMASSAYQWRNGVKSMLNVGIIINIGEMEIWRHQMAKESENNNNESMAKSESLESVKGGAKENGE
jgi:hypothetical protein